MKDLIEKILKYLPRYLTDFGALFSGPKRFIGERNTETDETFGDSLLFLGLSVALVVVMTAPLLPVGNDFWTYVGAKAVTCLAAVSLSGLGVGLAWRLVGGKAPLRSFFITYAYFFGVIIVMLTFFSVVGDGVLKVFEPELYKKLAEFRAHRQPMPDMSSSGALMAYGIIFITGFVLMSVWAFLAWGAYRQINHLSKARSFGALMITGLFTWLTAPVIFFLERAMI